MFKVNKFEFLASEICEIAGSSLVGKDITVNNVQRIEEVHQNAMILCLLKDKNILKDIYCDCLVFCTKETTVDNPKLSYIISDNPKLKFFKFINEFVVTETDYWYSDIVSVKSEKYPMVEFGYNVKIGKNVIIAPGNKIGNNSVIGSNVVIRSNVEIGDYCVIKDNTVIGSEGFDFLPSENGILQIPQIGGIKIKNYVTIGSNCSIEKPALGFTTIHNNVKIDDLVQIGHNQEIGENTIIATGFKAENEVIIGSNTFIGMGVTIVSKNVTVGNNCLIGAGTVLTKSVSDNKVIYSESKLHIKEIEKKKENIF